MTGTATGRHHPRRLRLRWEAMSISRYVDSWFEENGAKPIAEVEPDHSCQQFLPSDDVIIIAKNSQSGTDHTDLDAARNLVGKLLR